MSYCQLNFPKAACAEDIFWTEMHCHCLPGVDDGPADLAEALALCCRMANQGIKRVIATPHYSASGVGAPSRGAIIHATAELNNALNARNIEIEVFIGAEIRIADDLLDGATPSRVITLANAGRHVLLELPDVFINILPLVETLSAAGIKAVIAHPERNPSLLSHLPAALHWLQRGATWQVSAGSLLGDFGGLAMRASWELLAAGGVTLVASDAHDLHSRAPQLRRACEAITRRMGPPLARRLCLENPFRVLMGQDVLPAVGLCVPEVQA